ncbi:unnamed protein product [Lactuca saligna]|uniref:Uncharacterized protein n=1 Tax=Lactuca saligna TaxID=75948 RepID=A0AA35VCJ2_LACSI|nr:unnamed protein product [Lactuca saligna]
MILYQTTSTQEETEEGDKFDTTQKTSLADSQSTPKSSAFTPPTIYAMVDKVVEESLKKNASTCTSLIQKLSSQPSFSLGITPDIKDDVNSPKPYTRSSKDEEHINREEKKDEEQINREEKKDEEQIQTKKECGNKGKGKAIFIEEKHEEKSIRKEKEESYFTHYSDRTVEAKDVLFTEEKLIANSIF